MTWVAPWTPGLPQKRCPTCKPFQGKQPLVVATTMIDGVCAQCAKRPTKVEPAPEPVSAEPESLF